MIDNMLYWSGTTMVNSYAKLMLNMDIEQHAPLPDGPKIIAPNHPTTTDPFLATTLVSERVYILVDETLFKVPAFGAYLRRTGHVPVIQEQGRAAFAEAQRLLRAGKTLVIFPEGAISPPEGGFAPAHTGAARLALLTGAPVIPVGIDLPRNRIRYLHTMVDGQPEVARWYIRGPYAVTVGVPLYFKGDIENRAYVRGITDHIMTSIRCLAGESARRLQERQPAPSPITGWKMPVALKQIYARGG